jgi:hypothetical protein
VLDLPDLNIIIIKPVLTFIELTQRLSTWSCD